VPEYLKTGNYKTKSSVQTISNAMDVGAPSNFIRIEELHGNSFDALKKNLSGYSYSDTETTEAVNYLNNTHSYIADPHGAIGYLALKEFLKKEPNAYGVFLETAHPIKFLPVMPKSIAENMSIPSQIEAIMYKKKQSILINNYQELKQYLLN